MLAIAVVLEPGEPDVRHTLVCRDLTEEVCQRDERQTEGSSEQVLSTRSVGMNLARPFKAGKGQRGVRVASRRLKLALEFNRRYATTASNAPVPALKGRAKFMPTLRVEDTCSEVPEMCRTCRMVGLSLMQKQFLMSGVPGRYRSRF